MGKLYLGVARECITPEIGCQLYGYSPDVFSESVEDDLAATAYYFKQGDTQALMVNLTVCSVRIDFADEIRSLIEQKFSIPKEYCMLCATHTHSGPNTSGSTGWGDMDRKYCDEIFVPGILKAVEKAIANPVAVKMGVASGDSLVGVNRREDADNNRVGLGQRPWGPFDPKMTVIAFVDEEENPVANIVHYGCHGTCAGANHEISRDWSGVMIDALESVSGAPTAFFNGPEGDIGPRLSNQKTTGNLSHVYETGGVAARDAVNIYKKIFSYHDADLAVSNKDLPLPIKQRMSRAEAEAMYEKYKDKTVNWQGMLKRYSEDVIQSYEDGYVDKETSSVNQIVIALGDIVFASFPYELFSEVGLRINKHFKNKSILSLALTNGNEGYFATQEAICRGGYEVTCFVYSKLQPFCNDADYYLMKETVEHIENLFEKEG